MQITLMDLNYNWRLDQTNFTKDKGTVFSCFACGGGSTMGYKLAGFNVVGCNELDTKMAEVYYENHHPKYIFCEDIRIFKERESYPPELYNLDILDGSPPCSSFSMSGNREKDWGKEKVFREGQKSQILDTLFFDFIDLVKKLQPKIVIAENVKGLIQGDAKSYVKRIYLALDSAGYYVQHHLLNASNMGVPQRRERVFFIAIRKDLRNKIPINIVDSFNYSPYLDLNFNEKEILYSEVFDGLGDKLTEHKLRIWNMKIDGDLSPFDTQNRVGEKGTSFNTIYIYNNSVCPTITSKHNLHISFEKPVYLSSNEIIKISSFPEDYNFLRNHTEYICGMSVTPLMTAKISQRILEQWMPYISEFSLF